MNCQSCNDSGTLCPVTFQRETKNHKSFHNIPMSSLTWKDFPEFKFDTRRLPHNDSVCILRVEDIEMIQVFAPMDPDYSSCCSCRSKSLHLLFAHYLGLSVCIFYEYKGVATFLPSGKLIL